MASTNIPSSDVNQDYSEDKLFKRFINRKTIEDSMLEEGYHAKKKSVVAKSIINRNTCMNASPRKISLESSFGSPRKTEINSLLKSPISNYRQSVLWNQSNPLSLYLNEADVLVKKKSKVLQPLSQFVRSSDSE